MATYSYEYKQAINVNPDIPNKNKVTDSDLNLIKDVGNQILTTMGVYEDTWNGNYTYEEGEIAIYDNRIFKNLTGINTQITPDQDTTNWEEVTISAMASGAEIPIRPTAPDNPQDDDLWIDTSDYSVGYEDKYSTTEVKTNKIWIDGKPIYRVCKNIGYLPNNGRIEPSFSGLIPLNVFVTNIYGIGERISENAVDYRPLNEVTITLLYRSNTGTLYVDTNADSSAYTGIVVIEYTKPN